jgi:outer membrane receptor protein involved in Fe transport
VPVRIDRLGERHGFVWVELSLVHAGENPRLLRFLRDTRAPVAHRRVLCPNVEWSPATYFVDSANAVRNDKYAAVNVKAGYDWERWGLYFEATNLTDRIYSPSVVVDADNGRFFEPANGRSVYGRLRWHF